MKRFREENGNIITEDELEKEFNKLKKTGDTEAETFAEYKRNCLEKNGTLEIVANDYDIENKRRWTATKIAAQSDMKYGDILNVLQKYNVHGNWTPWEINNRPVDYDELTEMVEQELRR